MPGRPKLQLIVLAFLFLLLPEKLLMAQHQPLLNKKISINFKDIPISSALSAIGKQLGVKFSYNPELISSGKKANRQFDNVPLREVLKQLINDPTIVFREMGNQIVLYRGDPSMLPLEPNQQLIKSKPQILQTSKKNPDTVFVYQLDTLILKKTDTVFRNITMVHRDTVLRRDTVYVDRKMHKLPSAIFFNDTICTDALAQSKNFAKRGFYLGLYAETLSGNTTFKNKAPDPNDYFDEMKQANSGIRFNYSVGLTGNYRFHKWGLGIGAGLMTTGEKFNYAFLIESGGFFKKDTVEKYYTLTGIDTTWYYITDSTWIPKDQKKYSYRYSNSYTYFDIPFTFKHTFWQGHKTEFYLMAGGNASILIKVDAMRVGSDGKSVAMIGRSDLNPILFSWKIGLGSEIQLNSKTNLSLEIVYRKQTNGQYKDMVIDKRYSMLSYRIAVSRKLSTR